MNCSVERMDDVHYDTMRSEQRMFCFNHFRLTDQTKSTVGFPKLRSPRYDILLFLFSVVPFRFVFVEVFHRTIVVHFALVRGIIIVFSRSRCGWRIVTVIGRGTRYETDVVDGHGTLGVS